MRYYKSYVDSYLYGLGIGCSGVTITEEEYHNILSVIRSKPIPPDGYDYRLTADLTWEEYELPPEPDEPNVYTQESLEAMTNAELEQILYCYGRTANMNKENMIQLILNAQNQNETN